MENIKHIKIFRKRFMPNETLHLKNDIIIHSDEQCLVTKWKSIKPRNDFTHGYSYYMLNENIKVSKFFNAQDICIYIYCDIIEVELNDNEYLFTDLLADVIVYENGFTKVLDLAEIPEALDEGLITLDQAKKALIVLDKLLNMIYDGKLDGFIKQLDGFIKNGQK